MKTRSIVFYAIITCLLIVCLGSLARAQTSPSQLSITTESLPELVEHKQEPTELDVPHSNWVSSQILTTPADVWVTGFDVTINNAPPDILHHLHVFRLDQDRQQTCPVSSSQYPLSGFISKKLTEIFLASRNTISESIVLPESYGIFIPKGTPLSTLAMLHHTSPPTGSGGNYKDVSVSVTLHTKPKESPLHNVDFYSLILDDSPCAFPMSHQAFAVPTGSGEFTMTGDNSGQYPLSYKFSQPGKLVWAGANFWPAKGGKSVDVLLNDNSLHTFKATQNNPKTPWAWAIPPVNLHQQVQAGDVLGIQATYTKNSQKSVGDASGVIGVYFAPNTTPVK